VKGSVTRGDMETWHWENKHVSEPRLEFVARRLGPSGKRKEFLVERSIKGVEFGYDGPCIDGHFGNTAMWGFESKDAGYLAQVCDFESLPELIRRPTLQLAPTMGELGCRGFYSNEIRATTEDYELVDVGKEIFIPSGTPFLIDPCLRMGSPPSEAYIEMFNNWAEVIWAGANGEVVDLEPDEDDTYFAQIVLKSDWVTEDDEYLPVRFPDEIRRWVKLHNYCIVDGEVTVTPQQFPEFGSVIGIGSTREEAQKMAIANAEQVEALDIEFAHDVFDTIDKHVNDAASIGVKF
jgi:hypothetical protein